VVGKAKGKADREGDDGRTKQGNRVHEESKKDPRNQTLGQQPLTEGGKTNERHQHRNKRYRALTKVNRKKGKIAKERKSEMPATPLDYVT